MILVLIGISFIAGVILGCHLTMPIVMQIIKGVDKHSYDKGVLETLERFKNAHKKNN